MFNLISLLIGLVTFIFLVVVFIVPLVGGIGAWLALVAAIIATGIGQLSSSKTGRNFGIFFNPRVQLDCG